MKQRKAHRSLRSPTLIQPSLSTTVSLSTPLNHLHHHPPTLHTNEKRDIKTKGGRCMSHKHNTYALCLCLCLSLSLSHIHAHHLSFLKILIPLPLQQFPTNPLLLSSGSTLLQPPPSPPRQVQAMSSFSYWLSSCPCFLVAHA